MDFKVIWSDGAIADLQDICSYIARHEPQAAHRWVAAFSTMFAFLAPSRSLARSIREAHEAPCARLSSVLTESFTTFPRRLGALRLFTYGTVRAKNRHSEPLPTARRRSGENTPPGLRVRSKRFLSLSRRKTPELRRLFRADMMTG